MRELEIVFVFLSPGSFTEAGGLNECCGRHHTGLSKFTLLRGALIPERGFSCGSSPEGSHWPMREVPGCQRLLDKFRSVICALAPPAGSGRGLATPEPHLCSSFPHLTQPATPLSLERASSINHKHRNPHLTRCFQGSLPSTPAHLRVTAP